MCADAATEIAVIFGEMARTATIRAAIPCILYSLSKVDLDRVLREHPAVAVKIRKVAEERLAQLQQMKTPAKIARESTNMFKNVLAAKSAARDAALQDARKGAVKSEPSLNVVNASTANEKPARKGRISPMPLAAGVVIDREQQEIATASIESLHLTKGLEN